ncbi:MAG TPA: hypothetical protein VKD91_23900, partial [Pyrinomonadaceae bacterium]|nr:hypothetical protein [Pyrinomonadaceae bacterium]
TSGCDIGNGDESGIVHRDAVNHGKIRGARVWIGVAHLGGVNPEELTGWETPLQTRQLTKTVDETRTVVTRLLDASADQIMFHDGNNFTPEMVKAGCDLALRSRSQVSELTIRRTSFKSSTSHAGASIRQDRCTIDGSARIKT